MDALSARPMNAAAPAARTAPAWFAVALVAAVWMLSRPYLGVRHDGVLYLGQVLQHLHPGLLERDFFFAFGSQDRFSVFSSVLAAGQRALGLPATQLLVLLTCHAVLVAAAAWLVRTLPSPSERWLALVSLGAMSHFYGGFGIFSFAENFVTARTVAEPTALLALALWLAGRRVAAVPVWMAAMAMHPLVALPVAVVAWCLQLQQDRRWWWLAAAAPLAFVPAALGIAPFSGLLTPLDEPWLQPVRDLSPHLFISHWLLVDWMALLMDAAVLVAASRMLGPPIAGLARAMLLATAGLFAVSWVGADLLHNQLVTGLQLWRVQWVAHVLVVLVVPALLWRLWSPRRVDRLHAVATALAVCAVNGAWETSWLLCTVAAGTFVLRRSGREIEARVARLGLVAGTLALAGLSAALAGRSLLAMQVSMVELEPSLVAWSVLRVPTVSLGLAAWLLVAWHRGSLRILAGAAVSALLAWACLAWDRRSDWTREIERAQPGSHPFSARIPAGAQVYWPEQLAASWAWLGRPSHFSHQQAAGMLFNRGTALEFSRRREPLKPLLMQAELCQILGTLERDADPAGACVPEQELLDALCRDPAGPDFMILPYGERRGVVDRWTFERSGKPHTLYLYDCKQLR